jgi:tetratricopeptide (TPR) repeat protein
MMDHSKRKALLVAALLASAAMLAGCNEGNANSPKTDQPEQVLYTGKRAGMLEKLDKNFQNSNVHFKLGRSYREDGLWTKAEYHFETATRFDPTNRAAQAALTKLLIVGGEKAKADLGAKRYIKQAAYSLKETMKLANAFMGEQLEEYAVACYQQAARIWPESPDGHRELGRYYLSKNDKDVAKEYFKRSFRLDPTQSQVAGELGRLGVIVRVARDTEGPG